MKTEMLSSYQTKSGNIAVELFKHTSNSGRVSYSYTGKYGAGCRTHFNDACIAVRACLQYKRGYTLVSGLDVEKV
jgi:hypothetical protein